MICLMCVCVNVPHSQKRAAMSAAQIADYCALFSQGESLQLFQSAMGGGLRNCRCRGIAWRYFLGALSGPQESWIALLERQQIDYDVLCATLLDPSELDQEEVDLTVVNPLSVDESSPYAQYFASSALREQIDQDLMRLHPGNPFIVRPEVQRVLRRILYVWASSHPDLSYRQGMHELLAPLVSVIWEEAEEAEKAAEEARAAEEGGEGSGGGTIGGGGALVGRGFQPVSPAEAPPARALSAAEEEEREVRDLLFRPALGIGGGRGVGALLAADARGQRVL